MSEQPVPTDQHAAAYLQAAPDAIVAIRPDGQIVLANDQAEMLFGYSRDTLIGLGMETLIPDDLRVAHRAHHERFQRNPTSRQMGDAGSRLMARHSSGRLLPVEIALSPVDVQGVPHVMAIVRDVAERLAVEHERDMVRRSLDAVDDAVFMFAPDSLQFVYVNAAAESHTGYRAEELTGGMTPLDIDPDRDDSLRARIECLIDGSSTAQTFEAKLRRKDGTNAPVEVSLSYPAPTDTPGGPVVAIVRDITDRKEVEGRLRASEEAFRSAFEDAPVPMAMVDLSTPDRRTLIRANHAFGELLAIDPAEVAGRGLNELTHHDDVETDVVALAADGGSYHTEKRYRRADGSYVWGELRAALVKGPFEQQTSLAHIIDVTRRVEAEIERDRREFLLNALSGIRSSLLRETPIAEILTSIAHAAKEALSACHCVLVAPFDRPLEQWAMVSDLDDGSNGPQMPARSVAGDVAAHGEVVILEDLATEVSKSSTPSVLNDQLGPALFLPLQSSNTREGVLVVARRVGEAPFDDRDLETAATLANEAAVSIVLERARNDRRRLMLVEDRERIARDLHDVVIQRLFASGMNLQASLDIPERLRERAKDSIVDLDETISVIRQTIFHLTQPDTSWMGQIERVVDRHRAVGRNDVALEIDGDIESLPPAMGEQLVPALSELLSNVERHAQAERASVDISWNGRLLTMTVTDDGIGMTAGHSRGFGVSNLIKRAELLDGSVTFSPGPHGVGTRVQWVLPAPERS